MTLIGLVNASYSLPEGYIKLTLLIFALWTLNQVSHLEPAFSTHPSNWMAIHFTFMNSVFCFLDVFHAYR